MSESLKKGNLFSNHIEVFHSCFVLQVHGKTTKSMNEEIIIKFLQGQCSPEEEDLVLKWLQQSSENKRFFYEQKALLNYRKVIQFGTDEQLNQATAKFHSNVRRAESRSKKQFYLRFARYAAVVLFLLAVPAILYKTGYLSSFLERDSDIFHGFEPPQPQRLSISQSLVTAAPSRGGASSRLPRKFTRQESH